jgi:hypothetical protein
MYLCITSAFNSFRLYSHYLDKGFISANPVSRRNVRSLQGFHSQVVQKTALFNDCLKRKQIRTCAHDPYIYRENNEFLVSELLHLPPFNDMAYHSDWERIADIVPQVSIHESHWLKAVT